ncbi:DNA-dependent metalloprotease dvc-1-like isoform X2 [Homarus americanus]|nr:DNA-dependent metalloprotease dvc-1-like isoform X2 [Homarus americanus]
MIDPNPDIHTLFLTFNDQFFWGRLTGVEVKWSPRMTLCAGVCSYEGHGGLCSVRLSVPLLKLRPRKDLIETLLHEMIHAYLFVTANNRDRDGHGPEFHKHMYRINEVAGTKISVYHSFHDEVSVYRQHIWQCDGPCRTRRPYFGLVKRAMNRAPGPRDPWWERHRQSCGGTYTKIQEPDGYGDKKKKNLLTGTKKKENDRADIRNYIDFKGKGNSLVAGTSGSSHTSSKQETSMKNINKKNCFSKEIIPNFGETSNNNGNRTSDVIDSNRYCEGKLKNIHRLASTSSGTVSHVNIDSASRSRVHGFGGGPPAHKKPRSTPGGSTMGKPIGKAAGKPSSGFGTGLAMRGGGSRTVTVKGKTSTKTESQAGGGIKTESTTPETSKFQGQGFNLGGSRTGVSRLLSLSNSSHPSDPHTASASLGETEISTNTEGSFHTVRKEKLNEEQGSWISRSPTKGKSPLKGKKSSPNFQKSLDGYLLPSSSKLSDSGEEDFARCPVCDKAVSKRKINQHLDECLGEFDDEDNWNIKSKN